MVRNRIAIFAVVLGCLCVSQGPGSEVHEDNTSMLTVGVFIDFANLSENANRTIRIREGSTAFDCFAEVANLTYEEFSIGTYVTGIDGVMEDKSAGRFWLYWINEEYASVGVSEYGVKEGDNLSFVYSTMD